MRLARVTIGMRLMASVALALLLLAGLAGGMIFQLDQAADGASAETRAAIAGALRTLLWVAGAIALVQLLGGWLAARAIVYPLREMVGAVNRIARGDTSRPVDFGARQDEIGSMAQGLEALRRVANDAFAQGQMLGQLPNPVMVADPAENFRVTYMNQAGESLFAAMAHPAGLPPEVRSLLADRAALPRSTRIVLGAETLQLRISAILSRDGAYLGPMLRWTNVTGQVRLAEKFEQEVAAVVEAVGHAAGSMREVAEAMARTAAETGMRAGGVSAASDQAAANVQTVAASAEQLAASVHEISRQVSESARIAGQAAAQAEATDHSVHSLSEAAQRIGDVVRLIGDIASQTNLLALNATIEAARAGEAGRGFAVVAGEVKSLAGQTARATEEIAAQIAAMQGATGHAVEAIRSIGTTIDRMNEIATSIASAVEEQGAATAEIARSVQQASIGTSEVSGTMGAVSNAVGEAGAQAGQVLDAARQLSGDSDRLKGQVTGFLQALRAA